MNKFDNEKLRNVYGICVACKEATDYTAMREEYEEYLLNVYKDVFGEELGFLHYHMVERISEAAKKEMAFRFYTYNC